MISGLTCHRTRAGAWLATILAVLGVAILTAACAGPGVPTPAAPTPAGNCPASPPALQPAGTVTRIQVTTTLGIIQLEVDADLAPNAAANFVGLVRCGFYDGVTFHRIVPGFVIQGGDPDGTGAGGPGYTIPDDPVTTPYRRGTLAMARTAAPNSAGSQFFIVVDDAAAERGLAQANTYAIFGSVTAGMDVVDAIVAAADAENPTKPVTMTKVTVVP